MREILSQNETLKQEVARQEQEIKKRDDAIVELAAHLDRAMGGVITAGLEGESSDEGDIVPLGSEERPPSDDDYIRGEPRSGDKENMQPR